MTRQLTSRTSLNIRLGSSGRSQCIFTSIRLLARVAPHYHTSSGRTLKMERSGRFGPQDLANSYCAVGRINFQY